MKEVSKVAAGAVRKLGLRDPWLRLTSSRYRRIRTVMDDVLERTDAAGFEVLRRRFSREDTGYKYLDFSIHVEKMVTEAERLGLLDAPPMRMLDLGSGSGMFLHVLRCAGHDVLGLDLDEIAVYKAMTDLLGIPRIIHRIERYKPLPDFGEPFGVITAFSIMFDCHGLDIDEPVWLPPEWQFFIDDCLSRLELGGRLYIKFNPATKCDYDYMPDAVAEFLPTLPGAALSASKEDFCITRSSE